ncbi:N-acetylmuramoyl-L-alanine amidase [Paenibacillus azoreducens]|nr:N-acetylmuramoyl-L-alanine amidase [Paenibacillus azoreducens]
MYAVTIVAVVVTVWMLGFGPESIIQGVLAGAFAVYGNQFIKQATKEGGVNVNYRKDHIPKGTANNRRPGYPMSPTTITIHNTGNPSSTAANERSWLTNPSNTRTASFHIVVDSKEAIECTPLNENAWHAGDGSGAASGNRTSISIEICESGDYAKNLDNAVQLVASMLRVRGWGVERLRRHWDWSRKICPRLMYDSGKWTGWFDFKNRVAAELAGKDEDEVAKKELKELQVTLKEQAEWIKQQKERTEMTCPDWAKEAYGYYKPYIKDEKGSYDYWRQLVINYRKEKGIVVNKI